MNRLRNRDGAEGRVLVFQEEWFWLPSLHDGDIKWKHFPRYWPFARGSHRSPVNYLSQRPVARSFDVFFQLCLTEGLSKQSWDWWFGMPSRSLWRHCNENVLSNKILSYVSRVASLWILLCFLFFQEGVCNQIWLHRGEIRFVQNIIIHTSCELAVWLMDVFNS